MKHKFLIIALAFISGLTFAQTGKTLQTGDATINVEYRGGISASSVMQVPNDSMPHKLSGIELERRIRFNPKTRKFEGHNATDWNAFITDVTVFPLWSPIIKYKASEVVSREIDSQVYLFRSTDDTNTTEPLLNSTKPAWSPSPYGLTFLETWEPGTYNAGVIVERNGYAYYCLTTNSTDPQLLTPPDWIKLGKFRDIYDDSGTYDNGDVVVDFSNHVFISNYNSNTYPLDYGVVSKWQMISAQPNSITCWGDSLTFGSGSTGQGSYPSNLAMMTGLNVDNQGVPGETSTQIKARFMAHPEKWKNGTIFWVGYNNNTDTTTVKNDIAEMVAKLGHDRYLVVGLIKSTTDGDTYINPLNTYLKNTYKTRFIEAQNYIVSLYNSSYPQDAIDHANGDTPWSKRSDWLHLNNDGYYYMAKKINAYLGYLTGREDITQSNIKANYLQITDTDGAQRLPVEALELFYFKTTHTAYINGYNGETNTPTKVSIQYDHGSELKLVENGGTLKSGVLGGITSETLLAPLMKDGATGKWVEGSNASVNYVPVVNPNGSQRSSQIHDDGNTVGVNTGTDTESGAKFEVNGGAFLGSKGQARAFVTTVSPTKWLFQVRDVNVEQDAWLSANKWLFGSGVDDASGAKYQFNGGNISSGGEIFAAPGTTNNSVVVGSQVQKVIRQTETIDFPDFGSGNSAAFAVSFTVTGAAVGDTVDIIPPVSFSTTGTYENLIFSAFVSATNTVTAKVYNNAISGVAIPSESFKIIIRK